KKELKAKSTLLLSIPDEHLLKFHGIKDVKTLCEAINNAHDVPAARSKGQASSSTYADDVIDGTQVAGGHAYHEGEEILKEDRKEFEFQRQITIGFDKIKVECYNYHRRGHFARECMAPRN
ncbi:hypothetical protein Tco_1034441, partial [Tanacetum coccineum]